jgi:glycerol-3-phosphate acyltransferase PlsY
VDFAAYAVAAAGGYLLGSVPTGYLVGRAKGIDIRAVGSGNIGATNVFRVLGKAAGVMVLLVDAAKGFLAVWLTAKASGAFWGESSPGAVALAERLAVVAGVAAILGHNYTCWLGFRGGKGIATTAGVLIALVPTALLIILTVWIILFALTRYVSLASMAASFTLPFAVWLTGGSQPMILVTATLAVLALLKHRTNLQRLLQGTEHKVQWPRTSDPS